jgi:hypothetical protein
MAFKGRVTIFFRQADYGWSENFRLSSPTYNDCQVWASGYVQVRRHIMGQDAQIIGWRVSDDSVYRDAIVGSYNPVIENPDATGGFVAWSSEQPTVCVVLRLYGSPIARRFLYIRGLTALDTASEQAFTFNAFTQKNWQNYLAFIQTGPIVIPATLDTGAPPLLIINIEPKNLVVLADNTGLTVGQRVRVAGQRRRRNPVGYWTIGSLVGETSITLNACDLPADYVYDGTPCNLKTYASPPTDVAVSQVQIMRVGSHRTGRPFGAPRGRRSPVKY